LVSELYSKGDLERSLTYPITDTTNNNPNHGTPLNPYNDCYYTGGSSGGSGYAVGSGIIAIALGADGGGSIRIPSSYCGIYGLKPSHNRVSGYPTMSLAASTGVLGPMAANMLDLEIAYRVMASIDQENPIQRSFPPPTPLQTKSRREKVLGIFRPWFDRADDTVRNECTQAIKYLTTKLGYKIVDVNIPFIHEGQVAHAITILGEISTSFLKDVPHLTPANKVLVSVGSKTPAIDFLLAQKLRTLLMQHLGYLFQEHPGLIIVTPTTPNAGWHIEGGKGDLKYGVSDGDQSIKNMEYVWMANFCGLPSITFPVAYADPKEGDGAIPIGLMGTGEWGSEDQLIEFGYDGESWLSNGYEGGRRRPRNWVDVMAL
jgi:Asp-tRNA(Asn)/Glu-tRNA(Gln) amidotransferase A subunit family amidase